MSAFAGFLAVSFAAITIYYKINVRRAKRNAENPLIES